MAIAKNITSDFLPVKERRSAEQPPLPCISNRKPNSREWNLSGKFDIKRQKCASWQETTNLSKSIWQGCVYIRTEIESSQTESTLGNSVGSEGSDHTHSHILCEDLWGSGPLRSSASVLALASSSSSMILAGSESSLAAKCSGVQPQRRRKAWEKNTKRCWSVPFATVTGLDHGSFEFHFPRTTPCNSFPSKFRTTSVRGINRRAIFQELLEVVFVTAAHGIVQLRPA